MTCKDCIYFNRCVVLGVELDIKHNKEADKNCRHFKNKADFVKVEKYNELREDFIDFACSGVNNLAPYCKNRCVECVDERGWCRYGSSCKGFNPDGERRDT